MSGAVWQAPPELALGRLEILELRQEDPAQPPLPRPGEDKLGPLAVRAVEPLPDGRGWRLTVQPLAPGTYLVPPQDLGDGRSAPALRVTVPRTVPYGAAWMGVGGGGQDRLPPVPFPWPWALVLLLPLALLGWILVRRWRKGAPGRRRHAARRAFAHHWPPLDGGRGTLDAAHAAGRSLLAAHFGPEALSWDARTCRTRGLAPWAVWVGLMDAARFGAAGSAEWPPLTNLLSSLEGK
ncbi:MAG: hypothetical protein ABSH53_11515 [Holophaga sp.]